MFHTWPESAAQSRAHRCDTIRAIDFATSIYRKGEEGIKGLVKKANNQQFSAIFASPPHFSALRPGEDSVMKL
jgi:hypothetical protein